MLPSKTYKYFSHIHINITLCRQYKLENYEIYEIYKIFKTYLSAKDSTSSHHHRTGTTNKHPISQFDQKKNLAFCERKISIANFAVCDSSGKY